MTINRSRIRIAAVLLSATLAVSAALPLTAHAGPLLSGYGGPGQGNQAILGSTLLNGPGGGSGGSGGGAQGSSSSGSASTLAAPMANAGGTGGSSGTVRSSRSGHHGAPPSGAPQSGLEREFATSSYPTVEPAASSSAFGISGADVALLLAALAALAFTGALTWRLSHTRTVKGQG
jgi:hypothetical protein